MFSLPPARRNALLFVLLLVVSPLASTAAAASPMAATAAVGSVSSPATGPSSTTIPTASTATSTTAAAHPSAQTRSSPATALTRRSTSASRTTRATAGLDWQVHTEVSVEKDGTAVVTYTVNRSVDRLYLNHQMTTDVKVVEGKSAVYKDDYSYRWDTTESKSVTFRVQLGRSDYGSAVLEDSVVFRTRELLGVHRWETSTAPDRRLLTIDAPDGWTVAAPGKKVDSNTYELDRDRMGMLKDFVAVGDFEVATWRQDGETVRYAVLPSSTETPDPQKVRRVVMRTIPEMERTMGIETEYPRLVVVVPSSIESGGAARKHSFIVEDDLSVYEVQSGRSVYVHELAHTYQRWGGTHHDGIETWGQEGSASYLQHLVLYRADIVDEDRFRHMVLAYAKRKGGLPQTTAAGEPYYKGSAVWAALDLDIRARTNGEASIADVFARLNQQTDDSEHSYSVTRGEFLAILKDVTGLDYERFYSNYVESSKFPTELTSDAYSLSNPTTVRHGELSKSYYRDRIRTLRTENEKLRETISDEEKRVDQQRGRIVDLEQTVNAQRQNLTARRAELTDRKRTIDEQNERIATLESRLSASTESSAPGFGVPVAVAALLAVGFLSRRRVR